LIDPESLRMLMFGLALILVMLWRPAGLWPSSHHRRELAPNEVAVLKDQETMYDAAK
jgi:branched-chain amino acid transport system permease protein